MRRHLHMAPQEWDALPWYEQNAYREGLREEGLVEEHAPNPSPAPTPVASSTRVDEGRPVAERRHREGTSTVVERDYHHDLSGRPGEFAAIGFRERTLHR